MYNNYYPNQYSALNVPNYARQEIVHVNGENGARAYQLPPNSNVLLLDDTKPLVWLAQTDGAGYKTITAYEIKPYQEKSVDIGSLENRIARLEELINGKSNTSNVVKSENETNITA